jgi:hypothetical protein
MADASPITVFDLEAARQKAGLSQADCAALLGIASGKAFSSLLWRAKNTGTPGAMRDQTRAFDALAQMTSAAPTSDAIVVGDNVCAEVETPAAAAAAAPSAPDAEPQADEPVDEELAAREKANAEKQDGGDNPYIGKSIDELLAAAEKLGAPKLDEKGKKRALLVSEKKAIGAEFRRLAFAALGLQGGVPAALKTILLGFIAQALKCGKREASAIWDDALTDYAKANEKTPEQLEAEAKALADAEAAAEALRRDMEIAELETEVKHLALSPDLMAQIVQLAHDQGAIGEDAGITAVTMVMTSRLDRNKAMAMLRVGSPSSGKNFITDIVLGWLPQGVLIRVSGASQKSLFYEGGEDVDALKHRVLYVVEAAVIAAKGNQEHEFTQALRSLLSDNVLA